MGVHRFSGWWECENVVTLVRRRAWVRRRVRSFTVAAEQDEVVGMLPAEVGGSGLDTQAPAPAAAVQG